ncbi:ankyrin repeat, SAM and basic leucine zipper domain-containing protein 1 isoform X2 [Electrophorus electricus]|uniref:ankyrin repeat, SAM and basic leucine zipper domain-containing protein 1 isoform X2 n=1 Tax=Electrophorus electricus TaxID=8005 RepID=UPI0015CFBA25|nr:ankyrin repeat, SAM and basic leucine zipper domain-containing protein 1 isoform X2 [Electrophorus electricus]
MINNIEYAFPAGDESDENSDEWDIGFSSCTKRSDSEVSGTTLPVDDNVSALKKAISAGDVDLVQQLLDGGVDAETRLGFDWTPLMCAVHVAHHDLAELLLDHGANANFSRDHYTVLMAACTANSANEEKIAKCVALLLSRNADPNAYNRSHRTSLMLAARDGYCKVINLLVSHRAELNTQDESGHTALMVAVQYGQERAVLKLLQLGADRSIKTKAGKTAADLAKELKQPQISRILDSSGGSTFNDGVPSKTETEFTFLNQKPEPPCVSEESSAKLCDIELLLHGLNLEYLSDIMKENDITWSYLLTMEKEDLEKIGITNSKDQKKLLKAIQEMHLDKVDLDTMMQLNNIDNGSEELYNFLISLRQQCCYLTEMVQDVIRRFPRSPSELVLTWDPNKEAQSICAELVVQTRDLQKEVICLKDLLSKKWYDLMKDISSLKMDWGQPKGEFEPIPVDREEERS